MKNKPIILITHSTFQSKIALFFIKLSVRIAGGKPALVSPQSAKIPNHFHGLILYGGVDIDPNLYDSERKKSYHYDFARDQMELNYLKLAEKKQLPILGICRGAQLINVAHHGSLHLDMLKAYEKAQYSSNIWGFIFFRKRIKIIKDSLLFDILKTEKIKINSLHRQAIDTLGDGFKITATEENNVIQCIESINSQFYMGVQFHPEFLIYRTKIRRLFKQFIKAC